MKTIARRRFNTRITILKKAAGQNADYGTEEINWVPLREAYAEVRDMLPSRAERVAEGVSIANRPARIRMDWFADVDAAMRVQIGTRVLQIVGGPAELGFREGMELLCEEVSTLGNVA